MRNANLNYTKVAENTMHDFYLLKLHYGWYAIATPKGAHPDNSEGRTMGGFSTKKAAVAACKSWAIWMK